MRTKLTLLVLLLCFCQLAEAQITDTASYKHHIGIIASPSLDKLFRYNKDLPVGLIYKRQIKANAAFRTTLIGSTYSSAFSNSESNFNSDTEHSSYSVQLTGGYEWQAPLSDRWKLYYGAEAGPYYGKSVSSDTSNRNDYIYSETKRKTTNEQYGGILRPFAGLTFQINRKLYVATETAILASNYRGKNKVKTSEYYRSNEQISDFSSSNIKYKPLSNISLLLQF